MTARCRPETAAAAAARRHRKTRIIATLGPASRSHERLCELLLAGVDAVRLNFSHGTHEEHGRLVAAVRRASAATACPVAILQDLCGPKLRVGRVEDDLLVLRAGDELDVVEAAGIGTARRMMVEAAGTIATLGPRQVLRLADGQIELRVLARLEHGVRCRVVQGGSLRSRQGISVPAAHASLESFTRKDRRDLSFGLELGVDAVAVSFVRGPADILAVRAYLKRRGRQPFVIAKIERAEALANLPEILAVSSGVMVARGDLGVEIGVENVPLAQKRIIGEALRRHRPVITATQMLESMIERPVPTRAEVSDVANAVLEGTDALMLSAETAVGAHPVAAVATLVSVATRLESAGSVHTPLDLPVELEDLPLATARAARVAARACRAAAIVAFTDSGRTARLVSGMRPQRPILGFTYREETVRRMKLFWGVTPLWIPRARTNEAMLASAERMLLRHRFVRSGERIVIVCGESVHSGATNTVKIHVLGNPAGPARKRSATRR